MAYINQEMKKEKAPKVKAILSKYGLKGSLSIRNFSCLVLTIRSGIVNFEEYYLGEHKSESYDINVYHIEKYRDTPIVEMLKELLEVMNEGNHDNSDVMTDYFDVGWYVDIYIGKRDKPYILLDE